LFFSLFQVYVDSCDEDITTETLEILKSSSYSDDDDSAPPPAGCVLNVFRMSDELDKLEARVKEVKEEMTRIFQEAEENLSIFSEPCDLDHLERPYTPSSPSLPPYSMVNNEQHINVEDVNMEEGELVEDSQEILHPEKTTPPCDLDHPERTNTPSSPSLPPNRMLNEDENMEGELPEDSQMDEDCEDEVKQNNCRSQVPYSFL
jgi:hypothetical protein